MAIIELRQLVIIPKIIIVDKIVELAIEGSTVLPLLNFFLDFRNSDRQKRVPELRAFIAEVLE
jgi:hypothetical protein